MGAVVERTMGLEFDEQDIRTAMRNEGMMDSDIDELFKDESFIRRVSVKFEDLMLDVWEENMEKAVDHGLRFCKDSFWRARMGG